MNLPVHAGVLDLLVRILAILRGGDVVYQVP